MRICRLSLENFGLFRGRVEIDLTPREKIPEDSARSACWRHEWGREDNNPRGNPAFVCTVPWPSGKGCPQDQYHSYLQNCVHRDSLGFVPTSVRCRRSRV